MAMLAHRINTSRIRSLNIDNDQNDNVINMNFCLENLLPGNVLKHKDDADHVKNKEEYLHHYPVQSLALDLVVVLLLQLQLAVLFLRKKRLN